MNTWLVTWFDGVTMRSLTVQSDPFNLMNMISGAGCNNMYAIVKIEQVGR